MTARPEPRSIVVSIRFRPDEAAHVDAAGKSLTHPRGRADFCRAAALSAAKARIPPPSKPVRRPARRLPALDTRLLGQILGQLGKIGGNANQIAKIANATGTAPAVGAVADLIGEFAAIRQALTAALQGGEEAEGGA
jgi:hypothetical protein